MKQLSIATALLFAFAPSAFADENIRVRLNGLQEVPYVSTPGHARITAEINKAGTAIDWTLDYADMQADVTQAHIHIGQFRVNGAVVLWLCKTTQVTTGTDNICTPRSGSFSGTFTGDHVQNVPAQGFAPGELDEVIAAIRAGAAYANIHTQTSPGGEIRGQLRSRRHGHDHDD